MWWLRQLGISPTMQDTWVQIMGPGESGKGNAFSPLQYSL